MTLVSVEGANGSGKGTFINELVEQLQMLNVPCYVSHWNSYPATKKLINEEKDINGLKPYSHFYAHLLDLTFRYEKDILPRINKGGVVILDRYVETFYVRDCLRGIPEDLVTECTKEFKKPDIQVFMDTDYKTISKRMLEQIDTRSDYILGLDFLNYPDSRASMLEYLYKQVRVYKCIYQKDSHNLLKIEKEQEKKETIKKIIESIQK